MENIKYKLKDFRTKQNPVFWRVVNPPYILSSQGWRNFIQSTKTRQGDDCDLDHELLIDKFQA